MNFVKLEFCAVCVESNGSGVGKLLSNGFDPWDNRKYTHTHKFMQLVNEWSQHDSIHRFGIPNQVFPALSLLDFISVFVVVVAAVRIKLVHVHFFVVVEFLKTIIMLSVSGERAPETESLFTWYRPICSKTWARINQAKVATTTNKKKYYTIRSNRGSMH